MAATPRSPKAAEDLIQDVQVCLLAGRYSIKSNAFAMLCRIAEARWIDHLRHDSRCPSPDADLDSDEALSAACAASGADPWIRVRVQQRLQVMARERPTKARILELWAMGYSYREVASILLNKLDSDVTEPEIHQVRDKIHHARRAGREYLLPAR